MVAIYVNVNQAIMVRTARITLMNVHCTEHVMTLGQSCVLMGSITTRVTVKVVLKVRGLKNKKD